MEERFLELFLEECFSSEELCKFNFECKNGVFDKDIVSPVFSDENGDGIDELIVREGPLGGKILYAYLTEYNYDYMVDTTEYSLNNGWVEYGD